VNGVGTAYGSDMTFTTPEPLTAVNGTVTDVTGCFGNNNGAISTTLIGGTPPFTYVWSNGANTASVSGLAAGSYSVTVTDAANATVSGTWTVAEPTAIQLNATVTNTTCPGLTNGAINLAVTGGTGPHTYNWSSGAVETNISNLASGDYTVTVTDANNCIQTGTWTVAQANPVCENISVAGNVTSTVCYNAINTITVAGGTTPFVVEAPNGNATFIAGERVLLLPGTTVDSGAYLLAYISTTYCNTSTMPITATRAGETEPSISRSNSSFLLYPNPTTGNITVVQKGEHDSGCLKIEVYSMNGERVLTGSMFGVKKQEFDFSGMPRGLYFVKVVAEDCLETIKLIKL
jgi:hypothetical protein